MDSRPGYALAAGLVTFLLVFLVEITILSRRPAIALPAAAIVGAGFALLAFRRAS